MSYKLDTDSQVFFYEQEFYPFSNFSAFSLIWRGIRFDTSEAAYHWEKFPDHPMIQTDIRYAISAHEAFKIAEKNKAHVMMEWPEVRLGIMKDILRAKVTQHEYVRKKLLETGDRELIEDSWRDSFWGWGPNKDGQNQLGKLWMEIRSEMQPGLVLDKCSRCGSADKNVRKEVYSDSSLYDFIDCGDQWHRN